MSFWASRIFRRSKEPVPPSADEEGLPDLPETPEDMWLRHKGLFFFALLQKNRTKDEKQRIGSLLKKLFWRPDGTEIPESVRGDPNKIAAAFLDLVLRPAVFSSGKRGAGLKERNGIQKYLCDQWGYKEDAVSRGMSCVGRPNSIPDIMSRITAWTDDTPEQVDRYADAGQLRTKVRAVLRHSRESLLSSEALRNRYDVLDRLMEEYTIWKEVKAGQSYRITRHDSGMRVTVASLDSCRGRIELMEPSPEYDTLSKWGFEPDSQEGVGTQVSPTAASWLKLVCAQSGEEVGDLAADAGRKGNRWAIFKHSKEDRFAIFDACNDTILTGRDALSVVPVTAKTETDDLGCWHIEPHKD